MVQPPGQGWRGGEVVKEHIPGNSESGASRTSWWVRRGYVRQGGIQADRAVWPEHLEGTRFSDWEGKAYGKAVVELASARGV